MKSPAAAVLNAASDNANAAIREDLMLAPIVDVRKACIGDTGAMMQVDTELSVAVRDGRCRRC